MLDKVWISLLYLVLFFDFNPTSSVLMRETTRHEKHHIVKWIVRDVFEYEMGPHHWIESMNFKDAKDQYNFNLMLYPNGKSFLSDDYLAVGSLSSFGSGIISQFTYSLLDVWGGTHVRVSGEPLLTESKKLGKPVADVIYDFIRRDELLKNELIYLNGTITIQCDLLLQIMQHSVDEL